MPKIKLPVFFFLVLACLTFAPGAWGQTGAKSPPSVRNWGLTLGKVQREEMRFQEAVYWGCRMDVPGETVMEWQQASNGADRIERIKIGSVEKQELVLIQRMGGTMRCFSFSALRDTRDGWTKVWEDNGEGYCMMKCPGVEMKIFGPRLLLEVPKSSDPACKDTFQRKVFTWDGTTFRPAADHAVSGKPHPRTASTSQVR